ncbi:MAG TPA: hypothetical protein VMB71_12150 [Acetobacteraceae bacterium]|nr:hypothetical protein [Acetobacteraceae bacterium]
MPVDPCLPVPLGGVTTPTPPVHRVHRIIGRIRRHGTARHIGVKHAIAPLDGCGKVPAGLAQSLPNAPRVLPKVIPALATGGAAVIGGSGVIGGFGGGPGTVPPGGGNHVCVVNCGGGGTHVPEPASILIFGVALLLVATLRMFPRRA